MRAQVSLVLDGELSELERRMVAAHVDRCPDCRTFQAGVTAFTGELRTARLEELEHPIVVRRPRRVSLARAQMGVAAAVAVVALGAIAQTTGSESDRSSLRTPVRFETSSEAAREMAQILADGRAFKRQKGPLLAF